MQNESGQRRAKAGGEIGANGEWYAGGEFIANTDAPKGRLVHQASAEELARWEAAKAAQVDLARRHEAWRVARVVKFAPILEALEFSHRNQWGQLVPSENRFNLSLAQQLRSDGRLSEKQARYAARVAGRGLSADAQLDMAEGLAHSFEG